MLEDIRLHNPERDDARWMREALAAARGAGEDDEIPIGACIVSSEDQILAVAGNRTRRDCDPTAHAEILVLREAARVVGNYRLTGARLYVTIEPCAMCAGAMIQARIARLIYGARDERAGSIESHFRICDNSSLNHQIEYAGSVLETDCRALMQEFFRARRNAKAKAEG